MSHLPGSRSWIAFKDMDGKFPMGLAATNAVQEELEESRGVLGGQGWGALGGCVWGPGKGWVWVVGGPGVAGGDGGV